MSNKSISFDEVEKIIKDYSDDFAKEAAIGIGISERAGELKFIVMVEDEETMDTLSEKYNGKEIEGFPIHVEISCMPVIDRSVDNSVDYDPWPCWMTRRQHTWWVQILLSPLFTCSWLLWRIKGGEACGE